MPSDRHPPFADLVGVLSPVLLDFFGRQTGNRATAEDLTQEALLRVQRGLPGFDGRASVTTWALAIARRVAADHFRQAGAREPLGLGAESLALADPSPAADDRLAAAQMSDCVRQQIATLSPGDRSVLQLHDIEEMGIGGVAERCGCSEATARVRLHRARKRLRRSLEQECEFYREGDNVLRCCRKSGGE